MSIFVVFPLLGFTFFLILVLFIVVFARPLVSLFGPYSFLLCLWLGSGLTGSTFGFGFGVWRCGTVTVWAVPFPKAAGQAEE